MSSGGGGGGRGGGGRGGGGGGEEEEEEDCFHCRHQSHTTDGITFENFFRRIMHSFPPVMNEAEASRKKRNSFGKQVSSSVQPSLTHEGETVSCSSYWYLRKLCPLFC